MRRLCALLAALVVLAGCAATDNTEPPAPLPEITPSLRIEKLWGRFIGAQTQGRYVRFRPYLADDRLVVADTRGRVWSLQVDTGKVLWKTNTGLDLLGGVGGGEDVVVVGARTGEAVGLRLATGEELWRRRLSSEVLAVSDIDLGVVVARTGDGKLHALTAASGEVVWQAGRQTPALSLRGASRPVLTGGLVVTGFDTGKLVLLALDRGNVLWESAVTVPTGRSELERLVDIDGEIAVDGGRIYASAYQGQVAALSQRDGRILWSRDISSYTGLALDGDNLYITDEHGAVWCLDRETGAALWRQDALRRRGLTAPAVMGDYVVVGDYQGYLHWLSKFDGRFLARVQVDEAGMLATPLVRGDTVYALGNSDQLMAWQVAGSVTEKDREAWPGRSTFWPY